jgi:type VI secretion system protein ImpB
LRDLLGKLDGNDELDALLGNIVQNTEELKALRGSASQGSDSANEAEPAAE